MVEPFYKELGKKIAEWRKKRGLTQEEVGKLLSPPMKKATIARMEAGLQRVLSHSLAQLADVLGVDAHDLLPGRRSRRLSEARWQERTASRLRLIYGAAMDQPKRERITEKEGKDSRIQLEKELAEKLGLSASKARNLAGKLTRKR
jgi:transcriptional regulator with XRE-family HTH domain